MANHFIDTGAAGFGKAVIIQGTGIGAGLKEYRNILLGQQITVYTDHKNLTYKNFNTERFKYQTRKSQLAN